MLLASLPQTCAGRKLVHVPCSLATGPREILEYIWLGLRFFLRASSPHCISCECYLHCVFYFFMLRVFLVRLLPRHMWLSHCVSCRYNTYSIQVVDFFVLIFLVLIFSLLIFPLLIFPLLIFYSADFLYMILFADFCPLLCCLLILFC